MTRRRDLIDVAMGKSFADTLVAGGMLVNVATAELYQADVAIKGDRIAAVGDVGYARGPQTRIIDAEGRYLTPGLIEGHLHQYHSYLGINQFVEGLLRHGVTATADGFYAPGIVRGVEAIRFFKEAFERMPIRLIFVVPVLAWLQNRELGLTPTPGIEPKDMLEMLDWDGCYGLEEPPYLPIVEHWEEFLDLFDETLKRRKVVTGHASGIDFRQLQAYVAVGASTDHESIEADDAVAKARAGLKLLVRHGSGCLDLPEVVRAHTELGIDSRAFAFSSDVASVEKLLSEGTIDHHVRTAISRGVAPIRAVQMATINCAEAFFAQQDIGIIAPGRYADLLLVDDLADFSIDSVMVGGEVVVRGGELQVKLPETVYPQSFYGTVKTARALASSDLAFRVDDDRAEAEVRVIGVTDATLVTDERRAHLRAVDGVLVADVEHDVLLLAMIDRFGKGTGIGLGFVQGFGLRSGAFASTANAICENLVIVGTNPDDMAVAANHLADIGGGKVVVDGGEVRADVPMPILGLHADEPLQEVAEKFDRALATIADLGCTLTSAFSQLEFCFACGELGNIKLSEEGLLLINPPQRVEVVVG